VRAKIPEANNKRARPKPFNGVAKSKSKSPSYPDQPRAFVGLAKALEKVGTDILRISHNGTVYLYKLQETIPHRVANFLSGRKPSRSGEGLISTGPDAGATPSPREQLFSAKNLGPASPATKAYLAGLEERADRLKRHWQATGHDLQAKEAVKNGELVIESVRAKTVPVVSGRGKTLAVKSF
jgi:hypothetical protein